MQDKIAVVVGATSSIGLAIVNKLAGNGATLVLVDSDEKKLESHDSKIAVYDKYSISITDSNAVKATINSILNKYGKIDILVNNVDTNDGVPVSESTFDSWQNSLSENLSPVISFCLSVIPIMKNNKYGRIVTVGSLEYLGTANQSNYSAAKSAIFGMTRSFALELAKDGITVNQVIKGDVNTSEKEMTKEVEVKVAAQMPVQRVGRPDDIAYAVAYLAADTSGYVTGQNLIVCGGKSIYSSMSA